MRARTCGMFVECARPGICWCMFGFVACRKSIVALLACLLEKLLNILVLGKSQVPVLFMLFVVLFVTTLYDRQQPLKRMLTRVWSHWFPFVCLAVTNEHLMIQFYPYSCKMYQQRADRPGFVGSGAIQGPHSYVIPKYLILVLRNILWLMCVKCNICWLLIGTRPIRSMQPYCKLRSTSFLMIMFAVQTVHEHLFPTGPVRSGPVPCSDRILCLVNVCKIRYVYSSTRSGKVRLVIARWV